MAKDLDENKVIFANNLEKYLNIKRMTQNDLAKTLNIPEMTVSNWMNAKTYPRVDKIQLLADFFGIQKSDLTEAKTENNQIETKQKQLLNITNQLGRLTELYELDMITREDLISKSKELKDRKSVLETEIKKLQSAPEKKEARLALEKFDFSNATKQEQMLLIDTVVDRIELTHDNVDVYLNF